MPATLKLPGGLSARSLLKQVLLRLAGAAVLAAPPLFFFLDASTVESFRYEFSRYFALSHLNAVLPDSAKASPESPTPTTAQKMQEGMARAGGRARPQQGSQPSPPEQTPSGPASGVRFLLFGCLGASFALVWMGGRFLIRVNFTRPMAALEEEVK